MEAQRLPYAEPEPEMASVPDHRTTPPDESGIRRIPEAPEDLDPDQELDLSDELEALVLPLRKTLPPPIPAAARAPRRATPAPAAPEYEWVDFSGLVRSYPPKLGGVYLDPEAQEVPPVPGIPAALRASVAPPRPPRLSARQIDTLAKSAFVLLVVSAAAYLATL